MPQPKNPRPTKEVTRTSVQRRDMIAAHVCAAFIGQGELHNRARTEGIETATDIIAENSVIMTDVLLQYLGD